jgi:Domain of unknown function (DUF3806)
MDQKLSPLPQDEIDRLDKQRGYVRDHCPADSRNLYDTLEGKLNLLEAILDAESIKPHEAWKLQSLGVTFGDALAQKLGFVWILIEDEQGRDPALHNPGTTNICYPLTMISKRIERGERVDVRSLFDAICKASVLLRAESPLAGPH